MLIVGVDCFRERLICVAVRSPSSVTLLFSLLEWPGLPGNTTQTEGTFSAKKRFQPIVVQWVPCLPWWARKSIGHYFFPSFSVSLRLLDQFLLLSAPCRRYVPAVVRSRSGLCPIAIHFVAFPRVDVLFHPRGYGIWCRAFPLQAACCLFWKWIYLSIFGPCIQPTLAITSCTQGFWSSLISPNPISH